jgi:Leucine-rich repeat (LRR) protein
MACTNGPVSSPAAGQSSPENTDEIIQFTDAVLEAKIRKSLNKPQGAITVSEAQKVTALNLGNESFEKTDGLIKDIGDLQYFTDLEELNLSFNEISDLSPLANLKSLKSLAFNGTKVRDISALKGLSNMQCIVFCWINENYGTPGGIDNLDALADMQNLEMLDAKNAGIRDISGLSDLPKLWEVQLNQNQITDIRPLATLKSLKTLLLDENPVKDYSPLKEIYNNLEGKDFARP